MTALLASCGDAGSGTDDGDGVWDSSVRTLVVASKGGGFVPAPPTGSECAFGSGEYSLSFPTSSLTAWRCEHEGNLPYRKGTASRTLTSNEMNALTPELLQLTIDKSFRCVGADKPSIDLKIISERGTIEYRDAFYGCAEDPRLPVDSSALGSIYNKLTVLAFGS
jgi:hypothetical protein